MGKLLRKHTLLKIALIQAFLYVILEVKEVI